MSLATKRKRVLYVTPLVLACVRIEWCLKCPGDFRAWMETDSTLFYIELLVGWCLWLLGLWCIYWVAIGMTTFAVIYTIGEYLGGEHQDPQKPLNEETHVVVALTWLVITIGGWLITLGGWLIQNWPRAPFDSN